MPNQIISFDLGRYPELDSLITGQKIVFSVAGSVVTKDSSTVTIQTESIETIYKSKMSTQEILLSNMSYRLEEMSKNQANQKTAV